MHNMVVLSVVICTSLGLVSITISVTVSILHYWLILSVTPTVGLVTVGLYCQ